jgi:hypothetical protein
MTDPAAKKATPPNRTLRRRVLFHRCFDRFSGGHLKHWHYFNHVRASPNHDALIHHRDATVWDSQHPWLEERDAGEPTWDPGQADILFLEGMDWRHVPNAVAEAPPVPVINLIQHVRHADPGNPRYAFLGYPAIRICVSEDVAEALRLSGRVNGPVLTIPNGQDPDTLPAPLGETDRTVDLLVEGIKQPDRARKLVKRLRRPWWRLTGGGKVDILCDRVPRAVYLERLRCARTVLFLPGETEGFFLPALEAMALGTLVVCPDCVGNRSFCRPGETCFRPTYDDDALVQAVGEALALDGDARARMLATAHATATRHSLATEREACHEVLRRVDELWEFHDA